MLDLGAGAYLQFSQGLKKVGIVADVVSFSPAFADKKWFNKSGKRESDKIVAGMGEELPFADRTFDRIVCLDVVEHLQTRERYLIFLKEITRVLAHQGVAYIGPTAEGKDNRAGVIIPKQELENILENKVNVEWKLVQQKLKYFTLILQKKSHI